MIAVATYVRNWLQLAMQSARLMCGVPDYTAYLNHMRKKHPDLPAMSEADFFRARQDARYARGASRCC